MFISQFPISTFVFNLTEAIMLDLISMMSSCIRVRVVPLLSLNRSAKLGSKSLANVTLAVGWDGLTSTGILLYNLLNI